MPSLSWGYRHWRSFRVGRQTWWWLPCLVTSSIWSLRHSIRNGEFSALFKFHTMIQVLMQSHRAVWCTNGKGSWRGKQQCFDQENVAEGGLVICFGFQHYGLPENWIFKGEGRQTIDHLDWLRQRRGEHWHGSCVSLQVVAFLLRTFVRWRWYVLCREVAPGVRVLRAKFSEITRPSIDRAMATLGQVHESYFWLHWNMCCQCY